MSIQDFTTPVKYIFNLFNPSTEPVPHIGAVITADGFTGTYAGADVDSFGDVWHSVVSAFEQRHYRGDGFEWVYTWGSVQ